MPRILRRSTASPFGLGAILWIVIAASPAAEDPPARKGARSPAEAAARQQAGRAAEAFLVLVDKAKYSESYDAASSWFRRGITRRKWVDALGSSRTPLGRVLGRKLDRVELRSLGAPGVLDQAWIYSNVRFESREPCPELTVVFIEEGRWRMSAYFVGDPSTFPKPSPAPKPGANPVGP